MYHTHTHIQRESIHTENTQRTHSACAGHTGHTQRAHREHTRSTHGAHIYIHHTHTMIDVHAYNTYMHSTHTAHAHLVSEDEADSPVPREKVTQHRSQVLLQMHAVAPGAHSQQPHAQRSLQQKQTIRAYRQTQRHACACAISIMVQ